MMNYNAVILKPIISEKTTDMTDRLSRYGFLVALKSNKNQIKKAVENQYDVRVIKVWTSIRAGKSKRAGSVTKKLSGTKRAYVELAEGQKIEFFKGV